MTPISLIAIDPGTHRTGAALFRGTNLVECRLLEPDPNQPPEVRIRQIVAQLEQMAEDHPEVTELACEGTTGMEARRPAPELQTLVRRIRSWAKAKPRRWTWTAHHPSSVQATVRPRGLRTRGKETIQAGVTMLYGHQLGEEKPDQNILDAIAVGHCHIVNRTTMNGDSRTRTETGQ